MNKRFAEFLYQSTEENETLEKKVKNLEVNLKEMFIQRNQYLDQIRDLKKKLSILRKKAK